MHIDGSGGEKQRKEPIIANSGCNFGTMILTMPILFQVFVPRFDGIQGSTLGVVIQIIIATFGIPLVSLFRSVQPPAIEICCFCD